MGGEESKGGQIHKVNSFDYMIGQCGGRETAGG